jgi:Flp pilus assembly protein TadD
MHRDAASCGAKILACTVMTNLRDWEPFRSVHGKDTPSQKAKQYRELLALAAAVDPPAALDALRAATQLDPAYAEGWYRLGLHLLAAGQKDEAVKCLRRARDEDAIQARTNSRVNDIIRAFAEKGENKSIALADVETAMTADGAPGCDLYCDWAHLNFAGSIRVAEILLPHVLESLGLPAVSVPSKPLEDWEARLALTPWLKLRHLRNLEKIILNPLEGALGRKPLKEMVAQQHTILDASDTPDAPERQMETYRAAVERSPWDMILRERYAESLYVAWRYDLAWEQVRIMLEAEPRNAHALRLLGQIQLSRNNVPEAATALERVVQLYPDDPGAWSSLAEAYEKANRARDAGKARARSERLSYSGE